MKKQSKAKAYMVIVTECFRQYGEEVSDACTCREVPFIRFGKKHLLGRLLGKEIRSTAVITDSGFAQS